MEVNGYLIVTPKQTGNNYYPRRSAEVRYVKTKPTLRAKEIAFKMTIKLPSTLWDRPTPEVTLDVPKGILYDMDAETAVKLVAPEVADALKLEVESVQDGLTEMLKKKIEDEKGL